MTEVDPTGIIDAAIVHEQMLNFDCPLNPLIKELLTIYSASGDKRALDMAMKIALQSLTPKGPNLWERAKAHLFP